jgi:uncharacterized membrane protein
MWGLTDHLLPAVHGGGDGGLVGSLAELLAFFEGLLQLEPAEFFAGLMPGIAALPNVHPLLVHFPIALLTSFFLLDLLGSLMKRQEIRRTASWFLYLGAALSLFTVAAGLIAAGSVPHGDDVHEIMEHHEHLAITVLSLASALSVWRWIGKGVIEGAANRLHLLLAAILTGLLAFTADLGGLMVYKFGVGVAAANQINLPAAHQHQHSEELGHKQADDDQAESDVADHDHAHDDHSSH